MKAVLVLIAVVVVGWVAAAVAIVIFIFFISLVVGAAITLRSARGEKPEQADHSPVKKLVKQEVGESAPDEKRMAA